MADYFKSFQSILWGGALLLAYQPESKYNGGMNKSEISKRLNVLGLRHAADAYREEVRVRLTNVAGPNRDRAAVS